MRNGHRGRRWGSGVCPCLPARVRSPPDRTDGRTGPAGVSGRTMPDFQTFARSPHDRTDGRTGSAGVSGRTVRIFRRSLGHPTTEPMVGPGSAGVSGRTVRIFRRSLGHPTTDPMVGRARWADGPGGRARRRGQAGRRNVPNAAHRVDVRGMAGVRLDLRAQPVDVDVDRPGLAAVVVAPHMLEQLVASGDLTRVPDEERERLEGLRLDRQDLAVAEERCPPRSACTRPRSTTAGGPSTATFWSDRRKSARMRALSSRSEKGLVT